MAITLFQLDQCYCILHSIVRQKYSSDRTTVATPSRATETQSSGEGGEDDQHSLPAVEELKTTRKNSSVAESAGNGGNGAASGAPLGDDDDDNAMNLSTPRSRRRQGFDTVPVTDSPRTRRRRKLSSRKLFGVRGSEDIRRERILKASRTMLDDDSGRNGDVVSKSSTMATMRDILKTVHFNLERNESSKSYRRRR